jgi:hypothetical protein
MPPEWYAFFMALFSRTGGPGSPIDILTLQKQDEISQDVPPQNAATMSALRGVEELWSEQRAPENLSAILSRLADLENALQAYPDLGSIAQRLNDLESLLIDLPSRRDPTNTTPAMDGVAAFGNEQRYARGDHVHPTDTSRAPVASPTFTGVVTSPKYQTATFSGSVANATPITVFAIPNAAPGAYLVHVNVGIANDATNYSAFAVVLSDGTSARIALSNNAPNQTITLSGLNVQSTQNSGATQPINATIVKVG